VIEPKVPVLNLPAMQEETLPDPNKLPAIGKKLDFFVEDLVIENLNTSRPESA
jgi:hypothetical protein